VEWEVIKTDIMDYFVNEPRLSGLSAIVSNKTIMVDSDIADRAGPRLWESVRGDCPENQGIVTSTLLFRVFFCVIIFSEIHLLNG
jgi:hypothetical protein